MDLVSWALPTGRKFRNEFEITQKLSSVEKETRRFFTGIDAGRREAGRAFHLRYKKRRDLFQMGVFDSTGYFIYLKWSLRTRYYLRPTARYSPTEDIWYSRSSSLKSTWNGLNVWLKNSQVSNRINYKIIS